MRHLDLFSGIGGFALAAEWVWPEVEHTFCEIDPFCQAILKKHWSESYIYGDIRTLTADSNGTNGQTGADEKEAERRFKQTQLVSLGRHKFDLLTGGFPCQPFSQAGRRRGTEDDRHLWPEMLRVVREFHPQWVVGENVGGFVTWSDGMVLEQVHADLESEGYEVQSFIIPAVAVNAPHRRDRVWIVGHSQNTGGQEKVGQVCKRKSTNGSRSYSDAPDTLGARWGQGNANGSRIREGESAVGEQKRRGFADARGNEHWSQNWLEVAARLCRVDDGLPRRLDRSPRLKALGNAIVPQVAAEIFRAIKTADE